ncbi:MAG: hypothetical protein ACTJGR_06655 [Pauljensenia sp.]
MSTSRNTQRVQPWQWVVFAAVVALPVVVALAALPTMPEQVVMHWASTANPIDGDLPGPFSSCQRSDSSWLG